MNIINLKLKTFIISLLTILSVSIKAQTPKHEVRAVWLATIGGIDWPHSANTVQQQLELKEILDKLKKANINTVHIQTRVRASTIYPSDIEPFDICMTGKHGKNPGYDPLKFVIDECHQRGMECHAWMVTLPIGKWKEQRCKDFVKKNPGLTVRIGEEGYMNPEKPQTGDYLARICAEVTQKYDIDGIHLDYIRYPETWKLKISKQQARQNITNIVQKIHHAVKKLKPWVKISCSPVGKYKDVSRYSAGGWNAYNAVCQDAQGWLRDGLMDQLYPMMYFKGNQFFPFAVDWQEHNYGRMVIPGLGIYFLHPREGKWTLDIVQREMNVLRQEGMGHCFFRSKFLTDNTKGVYDFTLNFNSHPAVIPPMSWLNITPPTAPTSITVVRGEKTDLLTWSGARNNSDCPNLLYNVYCCRHTEPDTEKAKQLIATRVMGNILRIPHRQDEVLNYAVTAIDRYGNESKPAMDCILQTSTVFGKQRVEIISSDTYKIPSLFQNLDAEYILIESLQGQIVRMYPYQNQISTNKLPDGVYVLRSLGRKGVTHRIGTFAIKRENKNKTKHTE